MYRKLIISIIIVIILVSLGMLGWSILLSMLNTNAFAPKVKLSSKEEKMLATLSEECKCEVSILYDYDFIYKKGLFDTTLAPAHHYTPAPDSIRLKMDTIIVIPALGIPKPVDTAKERLLKQLQLEPERLMVVLSWTKGMGHEDYRISDDICYKDSIAILQHASKLIKAILPVLQHKGAYSGLRIYYTNYNIYNETLSGSDCNKFVDFKIEGNKGVYEFSHMQ